MLLSASGGTATHGPQVSEVAEGPQGQGPGEWKKGKRGDRGIGLDGGSGGGIEGVGLVGGVTESVKKKPAAHRSCSCKDVDFCFLCCSVVGTYKRVLLCPRSISFPTTLSPSSTGCCHIPQSTCLARLGLLVSRLLRRAQPQHRREGAFARVPPLGVAGREL